MLLVFYLVTSSFSAIRFRSINIFFDFSPYHDINDRLCALYPISVRFLSKFFPELYLICFFRIWVIPKLRNSVLTERKFPFGKIYLKDGTEVIPKIRNWKFPLIFQWKFNFFLKKNFFFSFFIFLLPK